MFSLQGRTLNQELYAGALSNAYSWFQRIYDPDFALEQDPETWRKIWRDAKIAQAMQTRMHWVAGLDWSVVPTARLPEESDRQAADLVGEALSQIRNFSDARGLLSQFVFHGVSYAFIEGRRKTINLGGLGARPWWVPTRLRHIDKRRFLVQADKAEAGKSIDLKLMISSIQKSSTWVEVGEDFRRRLIRCVYLDEESRLSAGRGMLESIYFLWWAKQEVMRSGLQGIERWAGGIIGAKVDLEAQAGEEGKSPSDVRDDFVDALEKMRGRHVIALGRDDEVFSLEGGGTGNQIVMQMLEYIDNCTISLFLGSVLPFGQASDAGSFARAREEKDTSIMLIDFNRESLSEAISAALVPCFWSYNAKSLAELGLD